MAIRNDQVRAAISGVGMAAPGREHRRPIMELMLDAVEEALADAGLTYSDIDGLATFPVRGTLVTDSPIEVLHLRETLGLNCNFFYGGVEGPGQFSSIMA